MCPTGRSLLPLPLPPPERQVCFKDPGFLLLLPFSNFSWLQGLFLAACLLKIALSCLELRHKR